jgi:hypothetical protein
VSDNDSDQGNLHLMEERNTKFLILNPSANTLLWQLGISQQRNPGGVAPRQRRKSQHPHNRGATARERAAGGSSLEVVKLLVEHGAYMKDSIALHEVASVSPSKADQSNYP